MTDQAKPSPKPAAKRRPTKRWIDTGHEDEEQASGLSILNAVPSLLASFLLNISLILILALLVLKTTQEVTVSLEAGEIDATSLEDDNINLENVEFNDSELFESEFTEAPSESLTETSEPLSFETDLLTETSSLLASDTTSFDGDDIGQLSLAELTNEMGGRGEGSRAQLLRKFGGNVASENAVALALQWIADHQLPDGSWDLDHTKGPTVNGRTRNSPHPGEISDAPFGATALALLPFLGNGQTHRNGKHKKVVFDGLKFLMERPNKYRKARRGLCYWDEDGSMYSHGLVSIVFAECYAMTRDERLREFAEGSIEYIADCQDPVGGGWRYDFRKPGDTSAVGWQVMALKSGKLSGFDINKRTLKLANHFLDGVSTNYGAYYGYLSKPSKSKTDKFKADHRAQSAVGLLCRMYLGWDKERPGIIEGVDWFSELGPDVATDGSVVNMYYNYYATQVMKHYEGEKWRKWNLQMRDFLVDTQVKKGAALGSWHFNPRGRFQGPAGRLYTTALACMTLEVYYRFLPLYQNAATEDDFVTD